MAASRKKKKGGGKPVSKRRRSRAPEAVANRKNTSIPSPSPFETIWARRKFDVLGKKRKGEGRRVGLSRSLAVEKRKKTLLQEYKQRGKVNAFLDHRFGEDDQSLADEDKAILRFQRERQAQLQRKSKFALPDEDDDEILLTHGGSALSTLDDFKDDSLLEDEDDMQELDDELVRDLHFGGGTSLKGDNHSGDEHEKKPKSKKEIMEEIIAKSKLYKAQKAKDKEEDAELKEQLDREFAALAQSQALTSLVRSKKISVLNSMLSGTSTKEGITSARPDVADQTGYEKEKPDDFDKLVKEMGMEMRAHASDRLKTEEELAQEERARLEELEEKRKRRMLGDSGSDSEGEERNSDEESLRRKKKKRLELSGDDLGENFLMEDEQQGRGWVDEVLARDEDKETSNGEDYESDEDGEEISGDEAGITEESFEDEDDDGSSFESELSEDGASDDSVQDWEPSDEEYMKSLPDNLVTQGAKPHDCKKGTTQASTAGESIEEARKTLTDGTNKDMKELKRLSKVDMLPYVIEAPKSLEEFKRLVDDRSIEDLLVAVQRIRTCNAIRLAAENRRKMQIFYGVLLQYFAAIAGESALDLDRVNALVKPLIEMSSETPYFAAVCARQWILRMRHQFLDKLRKSDESRCWPSVKTLLLLRLWSMIFPPSDFSHVVMTPAVLLMAEYLVRCPVKSGGDIAIGIFVCAMLLSVMRQARRFCPEALTFLNAVFVSSLRSNISSKDLADLCGCPAFMVELVASQPWLSLKGDGSTAEGILDFECVVTASETSAVFNSDNFRVAALCSALQVLRGFINIYEDLISFPEVFRPFFILLQKLSEEKFLQGDLKHLLNELIQHLKEKIDEHERMRQPLRMRMKKPTPIKQFNPKFEENFVQGRDYDPDRERAERKKLLRQLKREAKGATRELRKDNHFLQEEKAREKALFKEQQAEKYRKAMAFLQQQEAAFKSGQLGNARRKRR